MEQIETQIQRIIKDFDTPLTKKILNDFGPVAFKEKFLAIATNIDLSDVDDPELQPVFIENIDKIIALLNNK